MIKSNALYVTILLSVSAMLYGAQAAPIDSPCSSLLTINESLLPQAKGLTGTRHYRQYQDDFDQSIIIRVYRDTSCMRTDYMGEIVFYLRAKLCKYNPLDKSCDEDPFIAALEVKPLFRRQGIANILVEKALASIRSQVSADIYLEAEAFTANIEKDKQAYMSLKELVAFYEKHGAVEVTNNDTSVIMKFSMPIAQENRNIIT